MDLSRSENYTDKAKSNTCYARLRSYLAASIMKGE